MLILPTSLWRDLAIRGNKFTATVCPYFWHQLFGVTLAPMQEGRHQNCYLETTLYQQQNP